MKNYLLTSLYFISLSLNTNAWEPNDPLFFYQEEYGEIGFAYVGQWHLVNNAPERVYDEVNAKLDINVKPLWDRNITGKGSVIGIVDTFTQGDHPDLAPNYREDLSKHFHQNTSIDQIKKDAKNPRSRLNPPAHGTAVAGIAAARGGNGIGITGVAPYAGLAGLSGFDNNKGISSEIWHLSGVNETTGKYVSEPSIHIKNYSLARLIRDITQPLQQTSQNNVIHVFSSGNDRYYAGQTHNLNFLEYQNLPPSVIMVSCINAAGKYTSYSNPRPNVFVTAPAGEAKSFSIEGKIVKLALQYTSHLPGIFRIPTTDLSWESSGYNTGSPKPICRIGPLEVRVYDLPSPDYTYYFDGTSASTPMVAGTLALAKEVNPLLEHRMAKHCLVKTSRMIDKDDKSHAGTWVKNAAGIHFNNNYGFGLIDASALADAAEETAYITFEKFLTASNSQHIHIHNGTTIVQNFAFKDSSKYHTDLPIEQLVFSANLLFQDRKTCSDIQIDLFSPQGTQSKILAPPPYCTPKESADNFYGNSPKWNKCFALPKNYSFTTNAFWGENFSGEWTLTIQDPTNGLEAFSFQNLQATTFVGKRVPQLQGLQLLEENTRANALTLLKHNNNWFVIEKGKTLTLKDGILIRKGTLTVNGIVEETEYKGNRIDLDGDELNGEGTIYARRGFYNTEGNLKAHGLKIMGNYKQGPYGTLIIQLNPEGKSVLHITADADLQGTAQVQIMDDYELILGSQIDVLQTNSLQESITAFNFDFSQGELFTLFNKNNTLKLGVICDKSHCINPSVVLSATEDKEFLSGIEKINRSLTTSIPVYLHSQTKEIIPKLSIVLENQIPAINQNIPLKFLKDNDIQFLGMADEHTLLTLLLDRSTLYKGCPTIDTVKTFKIAEHIIEFSVTHSEPDQLFPHKGVHINIQSKKEIKESIIKPKKSSCDANRLTSFITTEPQELPVFVNSPTLVIGSADSSPTHLTLILNKGVQYDQSWQDDCDMCLASHYLGHANSRSEVIIHSEKLGEIVKFNIYNLQSQVFEYKKLGIRFFLSAKLTKDKSAYTLTWKVN